MGKKVLLIDLDPQCSLTTICLETSGFSFSDIPVEATLNYAFELYGETIKETSRLQILEGNIKSMYSYVKNIIKNIPSHGQLYFTPTSLNLKNNRINDIADRLSANYGIPITVSNGEIHTEYNGITDIINTIL